MSKILNVLAAIKEFFSGFAYDVFGKRTIPDDVPFLEITPHKYEYHACEFYCVYTVQLIPDGPSLMPFWDQNDRLCVEDKDGTIYRLKNEFENS